MSVENHKFSHPVYLTPQPKGFPLELGIGTWRQKKLQWRATGQRKKFEELRMSSAIWIQ